VTHLEPTCNVNSLRMTRAFTHEGDQDSDQPWASMHRGGGCYRSPARPRVEPITNTNPPPIETKDNPSYMPKSSSIIYPVHLKQRNDPAGAAVVTIFSKLLTRKYTITLSRVRCYQELYYGTCLAVLLCSTRNRSCSIVTVPISFLESIL